MLIEVGNYKLTSVGIIDGTRKITIENFYWPFNYQNVINIINQTGVYNNPTPTANLIGHGFPLAKLGQFNGLIRYATLDGTPVVTLSSSTGNINAGLHVYATTYTTPAGEECILNSTFISAAINASAGAGYGQASIVPIQGPAGISQRNIYRSLANSNASIYYCGSIYDNSLGSIFWDNLADSTILANATPPTISNNYDFDYSVIGFNMPPMSVSDYCFIQVDIPQDTTDLNQGVMLVQEQSPGILPVNDPEVATVSETNDASTTSLNPYYRELPVGNYPNFMAQIIATCASSASTFQIYGTLDNTITTPADLAALSTLSTSWFNVTPNIYGENNLSIPISPTGVFQDMRNWALDINGKPLIYDRFIFAYAPTNSVNSLQINVRKW